MFVFVYLYICLLFFLLVVPYYVVNKDEYIITVFSISVAAIHVIKFCYFLWFCRTEVLVYASVSDVSFNSQLPQCATTLFSSNFIL